MSEDNNANELSDADKQVIEMLKQANISASAVRSAPLQVARLNPGASGHTFWDTQVRVQYATLLLNWLTRTLNNGVKLLTTICLLPHLFPHTNE